MNITLCVRSFRNIFYLLGHEATCLYVIFKSWKYGINLDLSSHPVSSLTPKDIGLKLSDRPEIWQPLGNSAAEVPVNFQSDTNMSTSILLASRLRKIVQ